MKFRRRPLFFLHAAVLVSLAVRAEAIAAEAVPAPVAPAQSTGSYTVSYASCNTCLWDGLYESRPGSSSWTFVGRNSVSFSNRAEGTYRYRVHYGFYSGRWYSAQPGPEISVVVTSTPVVPPDITAQLEFSFEARAGDIDGDGRRDLLLRRTGATSGTVDGTIGAVLLRQQSGGTLAAEVPTDSQLAYAGNWPQLTTRAAVRDVNIDGFADVVLTGISRQYGFETVRDQILLAHGEIGHGMPPRLTPVDAGLARFARDIKPHLLDPEYFPNTVPIQYAVVTYYDFSCYYAGEFYWTEQAYISACFPSASYYYIAYRDFSVFHPDAVYIAGRDYSAIHGYESPEAAFDEIEQTLEGVLHAGVGGWDTEAVLGTGAGNATVRRGMELFSVLGAIVDAAADENGAAGAAGATNVDRVLLTGRRVMGYGPFHTALQYGATTISAYDDDRRALFDGTLVSQVNWPPDRPHLTMVLGAVDGPNSPSSYWASLLAADMAYDDDLRYDTFPSIGSGGYNSNSFTSGMAQATYGVSTVPMTRFVGGERPVPVAEFR
jgi:hypothetical protein